MNRIKFRNTSPKNYSVRFLLQPDYPREPADEEEYTNYISCETKWAFHIKIDLGRSAQITWCHSWFMWERFVTQRIIPWVIYLLIQNNREKLNLNKYSGGVSWPHSQWNFFLDTKIFFNWNFSCGLQSYENTIGWRTCLNKIKPNLYIWYQPLQFTLIYSKSHINKLNILC